VRANARPALSHARLSAVLSPPAGVSWGNGYVRVGVLVLYVHDVSDIFVDLLKMVNYLKLEGYRGFMGTEIAYTSCVLSWMYFRLYQFPFRAIYASFVEPLRLLTKHPRGPYSLLGLEWHPPDLPLYTEMNILLFTLLALHIYWFHLFLMIGWRILTESVREGATAFRSARLPPLTSLNCSRAFPSPLLPQPLGKSTKARAIRAILDSGITSCFVVSPSP
jgi:TLC domain